MSQNEIDRRTFLKIVGGASSIGLYALIMGGCVPIIEQEQLKQLKASIVTRPHFPLPDTDSLELSFDNKSKEKVVSPEALHKFGIDLTVVHLDKNVTRLVPDADVKAYIRQNSESEFDKVFGFLYEPTIYDNTLYDNTVRSLDIIIVNSGPRLVGPYSQDVAKAVFTDREDWSKKKIEDLIRETEKFNLKLPPFQTTNGFSTLTVNDSVNYKTALKEYEKSFSSPLTILEEMNKTLNLSGFAAGIVPELNYDGNHIISGPNGNPILTLRGRVYVAVTLHSPMYVEGAGVPPRTILTEKGMGKDIVHEIGHIWKMSETPDAQSSREYHANPRSIDSSYGSDDSALFLVRFPDYDFLTQQQTIDKIKVT